MENMEWREYAKRRLSNDERLAIMEMDMLSRSFAAAMAVLEPRLTAGGVKGVKRDMGMLKHICERMLKEALNCQPGVPEEIAAHIVRQSRDFRFALERIAPVRKQEEVVMPLKDEWQFIQIVLESRCAMCLKTPGEVRACQLRALLRKYADEPQPGSMCDCGFMGHVLGDSSKLSKQERL